MTEKQTISLTVNDEARIGEAEPRMLLIDFLRDGLRLTGTHVGCEHGVCGACTVIYNGEAVRSCLMFALQADGAEIQTVEGLAKGGEMHPLQKLFSEHRALQCGFCTAGMIMTVVELLQRNPNPTSQEVRQGIEGNICRCTGYQNIVRATLAAAEAGGG